MGCFSVFCQIGIQIGFVIDFMRAVVPADVSRMHLYTSKLKCLRIEILQFFESQNSRMKFRT